MSDKPQALLSDDELTAVLFLLDDADLLHTGVRDRPDTDLLLRMWDRLNLVHMARRGDREAADLLAMRYPAAARAVEDGAAAASPLSANDTRDE